MSEPTRDEPVIETRFILAIGLSVLILLGWQFFFAPKSAPNPVQAPAAATQARTEAPKPAPSPAPEPTAAPGAGAPATAAATREEVSVETDLFDVKLTNEGGRVVSWRLMDSASAAGGHVDIVPVVARAAGRLPFAFDLDDKGLAEKLNAALFAVARESVPAQGGLAGGEKIKFTWSDGAGLEAAKTLTFRTGSALVDVSVAVRDRGRQLPVRIAWGPGLEADDAVTSGYIHYTSQAILHTPGHLPLRKARQKLDQEMVVPESAGVNWAGLEEQYFAALILPKDGKGDVVVRHEEVTAAPTKPDEKPKSEPQLTVAVGLPTGEGQLFVGAKKFSRLRELGHGLEDAVWFSSYGLIYFFAKYLFLALLWIHDHVAPNYGLAIILATVALRLVLFPVNQYSMVKMRKTSAQMQRIQPKIKAIQQKYKKSKDPQARVKLNEETMALYKKEGVNPFGGVSGCLPMLAQFPILIAFYNVLTVAVELRGAPFFGWIGDLTQKDPFYVAPILMGVTMFVQQKMTPAAGVDPSQQRVMLLMPIVFTVMFLNLPSGLVLYWFVNNLLGIGQQWLVNRHIAKLDASPAQA